MAKDLHPFLVVPKTMIIPAWGERLLELGQWDASRDTRHCLWCSSGKLRRDWNIQSFLLKTHIWNKRAYWFITHKSHVVLISWLHGYNLQGSGHLHCGSQKYSSLLSTSQGSHGEVHDLGLANQMSVPRHWTWVNNPTTSVPVGNWFILAQQTASGPCSSTATLQGSFVYGHVPSLFYKVQISL